MKAQRPRPTQLGPRNARRGATADHFVQIYEHDTALVEALGEFVDDGLDEGAACLVVSTPEHEASLRATLEARGVDVEASIRAGQLLLADARTLLDSFSVDGWPDAARFNEIVGGRVAQAGRAGNGTLRVFGEMVALLWAEGKQEAAIRLEALWNELGRRHQFSLFCAYPVAAFRRDKDVLGLAEVCAAHGHAIPTETYSGLATVGERLNLVVQLQQRTWAEDRESRVRSDRERRIEQRKAQELAALENAQDAVLLVDPHGQILWANAKMREWLGTNEVHVGLFARSRFEPDPTEALWSSVVRGGGALSLTTNLKCADGTKRQVTIRASLVVLMEQARMRWCVSDAPESL